MKLAIIDDELDIRGEVIENYFRSRYFVESVSGFERIPEEGLSAFELISLDDSLGPHSTVHDHLRALAVNTQGQGVADCFRSAQVIVLHTSDNAGAAASHEILSRCLPRGVRLVRCAVGNMG